MVTDRQTDRHTLRDNYRNPRCACAPRVNNLQPNGSIKLFQCHIESHILEDRDFFRPGQHLIYGTVIITRGCLDEDVNCRGVLFAGKDLQFILDGGCVWQLDGTRDGVTVVHTISSARDRRFACIDCNMLKSQTGDGGRFCGEGVLFTCLQHVQLNVNYTSDHCYKSTM